MPFAITNNILPLCTSDDDGTLDPTIWCGYRPVLLVSRATSCGPHLAPMGHRRDWYFLRGRHAGRTLAGENHAVTCVAAKLMGRAGPILRSASRRHDT
eukprot:scaffold10803_cov36-Tisochrysis_lutea.AAC.4